MQDVFNVPANKCGLVIGKVCYLISLNSLVTWAMACEMFVECIVPLFSVCRL